MDSKRTAFSESDDLLLAQPSIAAPRERWVPNVSILWEHRRLLMRIAICALVVSTLLAFLLPKQYESKARIMPPEQQGGAAAMLAAISGKVMPTALSALAGSMMGIRNNGPLFIDLLNSGTVSGHLIDQFNLQTVYWKRYRQDAAKKLAHRTDITEDHKSGVITIIVTDTDRRRARDMTQAYITELDRLLAQVNTSAAGRERVFIEQRLAAVQADLERAQRDLSEFSSKNTTLDIKDQTRAMVEAGAKLQAQLIVARSELQSIAQIYGDENVRVRAARARVSELERQLGKLAGPSGGEPADADAGELYPPLRTLPVLAVQWADLYRKVKVQETVFELLTQQYELARIEEARSIPTVRVIDPPSWPEKKSFPPRLIIMLFSTILAVSAGAWFILARERWRNTPETDSRKALAQRMWSSLAPSFRLLGPRFRR